MQMSENDPTPANISSRVEDAMAYLRSLRTSIPYTAPEMVEQRYWTAVASVFNILDPTGRLAQKGPDAQNPPDNDVSQETRRSPGEGEQPGVE